MVNSAKARKMIAGLLTAFHKDRVNKDVTAYADINPVSML